MYSNFAQIKQKQQQQLQNEKEKKETWKPFTITKNINLKFLYWFESVEKNKKKILLKKW